MYIQQHLAHLDVADFIPDINDFGVKISSWIIKGANKGRVNCKNRDYVLNIVQRPIFTWHWHGLTFTRLLMFGDLAAVCFLN
jgi:hypothetical protein